MAAQNTETVVFKIDPGDQEVGERLDRVITARLSTLSRVKVQQLIKEGYATINGKPGKPSYRIEGQDEIAVRLAEHIIAPPNDEATLPEALPLNVIYEDADMAAIDKPAGMVVHPAAGHTSGTLVNALLARWPQVAQVGGKGRAGIVHRLDKDTSGVLLIAKTEPARLNLMAQFAARTVQKRYLALVEGLPATPTGEINAPLGRDPNQRKRMAVLRNGRPAVSFYRVLQAYKGYALVEVQPKTGRTHQIRVHMAFIGNPIVGDAVYGYHKQRLHLERHFLHAESLSLLTPSSGQPVTIHAPLPADLNAVLDQLERL
jgi:23S rRNA pseudouridine1911/1915/1917 synthase